MLTFTIHFQLGIAVGFVLPPILVGNSDDLEVIGSDLLFMFYCFAGFTTILMVLMIFCKMILLYPNIYYKHFCFYWSFQSPINETFFIFPYIFFSAVSINRYIVIFLRSTHKTIIGIRYELYTFYSYNVSLTSFAVIFKLWLSLAL